MRAFALLLLALAGGQHHRLRALHFEIRVVATVALQLLLVDVQDDVHYAVEKVAVVRDDQQRSLVALEPVLHPEDGIEIQVIGRLIQQQQVGGAHQRLS